MIFAVRKKLYITFILCITKRKVWYAHDDLRLTFLEAQRFFRADARHDIVQSQNGQKRKGCR